MSINGQSRIERKLRKPVEEKPKQFVLEVQWSDGTKIQSHVTEEVGNMVINELKQHKCIVYPEINNSITVIPLDSHVVKYIAFAEIT